MRFASTNTTAMDVTSVAFDGQAIKILSNIPHVHQHIREQFEFMLDETASTVSTLELYRQGTEYILTGPSFNDIHLTMAEPLLFLLKDEIRLEFMRARPDLLWLHAGAAEQNGNARVILGSSGQGKSTFTMCLCQNGWKLLSDDVVPISMDYDLAYPFPQLASRRVPASSEWTVFELASAPRQSARFNGDQLCRSPVPIGELVFPHFQRGEPASLKRLSKGEAAIEMLRSATNFCDHKGEAVARCAKMAEALPAYRIGYGSAKEACNLLVKLKNG